MYFGGYHMLFYHLRSLSALFVDTIVACTIFNIVLGVFMVLVLMELSACRMLFFDL